MLAGCWAVCAAIYWSFNFVPLIGICRSMPANDPKEEPANDNNEMPANGGDNREEENIRQWLNTS